MASPLNSSPTLTLPGSIGIPAVSPVYVEGIPAASVETTSLGPKSEHTFWSSQAHLPGSDIEESLVITLARNRIINYIDVKIAHFPADTAVWYYNDHIGYWQPVLRQNGTPLVFSISGSVPATVNSAAALSSSKHPFHYGANHWIQFNEALTNLSADKLRFTGIRHAATTAAAKGAFPVDTAGKIVAYPLGIKDLDFGFNLDDPGSVPWTARSGSTLTEREPFTDTDDPNGSPVLVAVRENRATDLLRGLSWRSAPQARSDAVVCLYADSRDENGNPQVIDRFYIDPLTSGVKLNLYYSLAGPPTVDFQALDDPILFPLVAVAGSQLPSVNGDGWAFPAVPGWVTLSNQGLGTASNLPWWVGLEVVPQFSSSDPGSYVIADSGLLQLYYEAGTWYATLAGGTLASWTFSFAAGDTLHFLAGYDGVQVFAWSPGSALSAVPAGADVPSAATFRFGASLEAEQQGSPLPGNYLLRAFILKQDLVDISAGPPQDFLDFIAGGAGYVCPAAGPGGTTINALCRFAGGFVLGDTNPGGFVGGPGSAFESCSWVPVQRNYTLAAGYLQFDPVTASVFKFEFTSLAAEPVDYAQPKSSKIKVFRPTSTASSDTSTNPTTIDPGQVVTAAVASSLQFADQAPPVTPAAPGATLPTETLYVTDPSAASEAAQAGGSLYNFQQWQPDQHSSNGKRQQATAGQHTYEELDVGQWSRVGYYVGLSALTMSRVSYLSQDDTDQYVETLGDTANIDPAYLGGSGSWQWAPGSLTVPPGLAGPATVQSLIFNSTHTVTGVQFATVQSPPVQLLNDPDFSDTTLADWAAAGDALPLTIAPVSAQLGNMVQVTRAEGAYGWAFLMDTFATWAALTTAMTDWGDLQQNNASSSYGGMQYISPPVSTTGAGRLYVAARVFAETALNAPLSLQLLDGVTGAVIAEADQTVLGGTVTEWYTGYTLGEVVYGTQTWTEMQSSWPTWAAFPAAGSPGARLANWDFEDGTEGWAGSEATIAQSATWASSGTYSLQVTASSAAAGAGFWQGSSPSFPVVPGQFYAATGVAYCPATLNEVGISLKWFDASSAYISTSAGAGIAITSAISSAISVTGAQAPPNAASVQVCPNDHEGSTTGTIFYVDNVSLYESISPAWDAIDVTVQPPGNSVTAQLIQKTPTDDIWYVDNLSTFEDAIVWEFSSDGGASWWPAYDVRNNPRGVMMFPPPAQGTGNQLMWRVQGYQQGLVVSSLVIRPWYSVWPNGILPRPGGIGYGPNVSPSDNYTQVENDPRWQLSASPVPEGWFFALQQALGIANPPSAPVLPPPEIPVPELTLGRAIVYEASEVPPPGPVTYSDFFGDVFTDTYGYPDGGDVFTDTYSDSYGSGYANAAGSGYNTNVQLTPGLVLGTLQNASATSASAVTTTADAASFTPVQPAAGAALGQVAGNSGEVSGFVALTGHQLDARRVYFGNQIPATLAGSLVENDAGVRRVSMDFQPDATTTPAQLSAFLASCATGGLDAEVTIWANVASSTFDTPAEYFAMLGQYVPAIRQNGYTHVLSLLNVSVVRSSVLGSWFPDPDLVDGLSVAFYCQSGAPGAPGGDTLAVAAATADANGLPFGLSEFGVDHTVYSEAQGGSFLRYIAGFFAARKTAGKPAGDAFLVSTGNYDLAEAPASYVPLYRQIGTSL